MINQNRFDYLQKRCEDCKNFEVEGYNLKTKNITKRTCATSRRRKKIACTKYKEAKK